MTDLSVNWNTGNNNSSSTTSKSDTPDCSEIQSSTSTSNINNKTNSNSEQTVQAKQRDYRDAATYEEALICIDFLEDDYEETKQDYIDAQKEYNDIISKPDNYSETQIKMAEMKLNIAKISQDLSKDSLDAANKDMQNWNVNANNKINESKQGSKGDCWFLSGLNSFSYTEKGAELIKDAITYDEENNTYNIYFKGIDKSFEVTSRDIYEAHKSFSSSEGDDDVIIFEIAAEKALNELIGKEEYEARSKQHISSLNGGSFDKFIRLFVGGNAEIIDNTKKNNITNLFNNDIDNFYNKFENNPDNYAVMLGFGSEEAEEGEEVFVKDINGNDVVICSGGVWHACSLKEVQGDIITFTNPYNSGEEIKVSRDSIEKYIQEIQYYEFKNFKSIMQI